MKHLHAIVSIVILLVAQVFATAATPEADAMWQRIEAQRGVSDTKASYAALQHKLLEFAQKYPQDGRASTAILDAAGYRPPGIRGSPERQAWSRELAGALQQVIERSASASDPAMPRLVARWAIALLEYDPERAWQVAQRLIDLDPGSHELWYITKSYFDRAVAAKGEAWSHAWLQDLARQNNKGAEWAGKQLAIYELRITPMEWKFTAVDGRSVDLAQLRGKVVLIDYWATWCPPCVAEIPKILEFYRLHRDKGFEVIGVSVDAESTRKQFFSFVAKHRLPWPQHCDFRGGETPPAVRFGIDSFPFILLLGRDGRLITTSAGSDFEGSVLPELHRLFDAEGTLPIAETKRASSE